MKKTLKIAVSMALALMMLITPSLAIIAPEDAAPTIPQITDNALFIPLDTAREVALLFLDDIMNTGMTEWNEQTAVTNVVTLYDQFGGINAYSVELTTGYVVVAAYMDVPNVILEWSDTSEPSYYTLNITAGEKVIYLGGVSYYKNTIDNQILTADNNAVNRYALENMISVRRDITNLSTAQTNSLARSIAAYSTNDTSIRDPYILDPIDHASIIYDDWFYCPSDSYYEDQWELYMDFIDVFISSDPGNCGPTAIANILAAFGNKYSIYEIYTCSNSELYDFVSDVGTLHDYYDNRYGGTPKATTKEYIETCFEYFNLNILVSSLTSASYSNIVRSLRNGSLLYFTVANHGIYNNHAMVCYGYMTLVSQTSGRTVHYVELADGHNSGPRYMEYSTFENSAEFFAVSL